MFCHANHLTQTSDKTSAQVESPAPFAVWHLSFLMSALQLSITSLCQISYNFQMRKLKQEINFLRVAVEDLTSLVKYPQKVSMIALTV